MSEYQYYEFVAVDRALDKRDLAELRALSTRADITPTSFTNTYEWGNFRGDPQRMMERYFDAHLYLANWGTRHLMLRLPAALLDTRIASDYCAADAAAVWTCGDHVILSLTREDEYDDEWDTDGQGVLASIIPVRAELAAGDLRLLYLAWLRCAQSELFDDDEPEPPVPDGLRELNAPLTAVIDFLRIDTDLLAAAAMASQPLSVREPSAAEMRRRITGLPLAEKDDILYRLISGTGTHLRAELLRRLRAEPAKAPASREPRSVAQLLDAAAERRAARERQAAAQRAREHAERERTAAAARERRLAALAADEPAAWQRVTELIDTRKPREYDTAVALLADLRTIGQRDGRATEFQQRLDALRTLHARKPSLLERFNRAGL